MLSLERKQIYIISAAVFLGVVFIVFGYIPIAWKKHVISKTLQRQSLTMDQVSTCSSLLKTLDKSIADLEPKSALFDKSVPESSQFASLWQQIAQLMTQHNLADQLVQPGADVRTGSFNTIALDIRCSGSMKDVFEFIRSLEQMDRLIRLDQMDMTNDAEMTGKLSFSAKASVFYRTSKEIKPS